MNTEPTMRPQGGPIDDASFIKTVLAPIPGWLNEVTAASTCVLLRHQDGIARTGGFVEIGVYGGKYLTLLARHAALHDSAVLGIDPFHHFSVEQVTQTIRSSAGGDIKVVLEKTSSQDVTTDDLRRLLGGGGARLIHIDGSHELADILWDLDIAEPLLTPSGILVLDDIFSPRDVDVTEAFFRFQIQRPRPLTPIAYVANKLFLTRHSHAPAYRAALEEFIMADTHYPETEKFRTFLKESRRMIESKLSGEPCLILV